MSKHKICIIYGFAEGRALGKALRREINNQNFIITNRASKADIILAHSGGCLLVPNNNQAKVIILLNPPYWPHKKIMLSAKQRAVRDLNYHKQNGLYFKKWAIQTFHHIKYILLFIPKTLRMYLSHKKTKFPIPREGQSIMILRNEHDPFCSPNIASELPQAKFYQFKQLPGEHDDIWHHPKPYVDIVRQMLK